MGDGETTGRHLTEERLRNHLDGNQPSRELLCAALLPSLGPYTLVKSRRPKGGRDGSRDIEAVYDASLIAWGGVGFRNGGGSDDRARREASRKFKSDLNDALKKNPTLQVFFFFTNVDLTPAQIEDLTAHAINAGPSVVDVFDFERLRATLDSPQGFIPRLQHLGILMSPEEQLGLVDRIGDQLQSAMSSRFDGVEATLSEMQRFLDFQKPIYRLDYFIELTRNAPSAEIGGQHVLIEVGGLFHNKTKYFTIISTIEGHHVSSTHPVCVPRFWTSSTPEKVETCAPNFGKRNVVTAHCSVVLTSGTTRSRLVDLTSVYLGIAVTEEIRPLIKRVRVDANGYELFDIVPEWSADDYKVDLPAALGVSHSSHSWSNMSADALRDIFFDPPIRSGRLAPLIAVPLPPR
jgi:hypothetical protein